MTGSSTTGSLSTRLTASLGSLGGSVDRMWKVGRTLRTDRSTAPQRNRGTTSRWKAQSVQTRAYLALLLLERHPDERAKLLRDPSLIPGAVEECLRFEAPAQYLARMTTTDVELHDT